MITLKCDNCGNKFKRRKPSIYRKNVFCTYECYQKFRESQTKNHDFFEKIDTEEKAYWLGFIYADGNISKKERKQKSLNLSLSSKDHDHVVSFGRIFGKKAKKYKRKNKNGKYELECSICSITSKKIWNDLNDIGIVPNKTYSDNNSFFDNIPDELIHHFVRGFFDGDGGICYSPNNDNYVIQMTGRILFLERIRNIIHEDVGLRKTKITKRKNTKVVSILQWSGTKQLILLREWLYDDSTIWLERKRKQFEGIKVKQKNSGSKYRGVYVNKRKHGKPFTASIYHEKSISLGSFDEEIDAAKAYDAAVIKYEKPKCRMNFK